MTRKEEIFAELKSKITMFKKDEEHGKISVCTKGCDDWGLILKNIWENKELFDGCTFDYDEVFELIVVTW